MARLLCPPERSISRGASLGDRDALETARSRKPPDRAVMHAETAHDVHLRLPNTQALDSFLAAGARELARTPEAHAPIRRALPLFANAQRSAIER